MNIKRGLLLLLFLILLIPFVLSQNGCCGETSFGASCVYTTQDSCATPELFSANVQCEDATFCEVGCCEKPDGMCADGSGQYSCDLIGGDWTSGTCDQVQACEEVCCSVGSTYIFTTQAHCESIFAETNVDIEYHSVSSEAECTELSRATSQGCCVSEDLGCTYSTFEECALDVDPSTGLGFHTGEFCSEVSDILSKGDYEAADFCSCEPRARASCDGPDIQYFDSCGNPEEVVECNYPADVCRVTGEDSAECLPAKCSETFKFDHEPFTAFNSYKVYPKGAGETDFTTFTLGQERQNGESWCIYEGPVGGFQDRVGTQHYLAYCLDGEEVITSCSEARESVCVANTDGVRFSASCIDNNHDEYYRQESVESEEFKTVYNSPVQSEFEATDYGVSTVPVATRFWEGDPQCDSASFLCNVWYGDTTGGEETKGWEAFVNTFCLRPEFVRTSMDYCGSRGDCGLKLNILGQEGSGNGFQVVADPPEVGFTKLDDQNKREVIVGVGGFSDNVQRGGCFQPQTQREGRLYTMMQGAQDYYDLKVDKSTDVFTCSFEGTGKNKDEYYDYLREQETISDEFGRSFMTSRWLDRATLARRSSAVLQGFVEGGQDQICSTSDERLGVVNEGLGFNVRASDVEYTTLLDGYSSHDEHTEVERKDRNLENRLADRSFDNVKRFWGELIADPEGNLLFNSFKSIKPWFFDTAALGVDGLEASGKADPESYLNFYAGNGLCGTEGNEWARTRQGGGRLKSELSYTCDNWDLAGVDSSQCELCDIPSTEGGLVLATGDVIHAGTSCNEYRCHSLGNCQFIEDNVGLNDPARPSCVANDDCELGGPSISYYPDPVEESLGLTPVVSDGGYSITNIPVRQTFQFGVETSAVTQCKFLDWDDIRDQGHSSIASYLQAKAPEYTPDQAYDFIDQGIPEEGEGLTRNHVVTWHIDEGNQEKLLYVFCQDSCGYNNLAPYTISLTTGDAPDFNPPLIEYTVPVDGGFVPAATNETTFKVGLNEPATCKWSDTKIDDFDLMPNTFERCDTIDEASEFGYFECYTPVSIDQTVTRYVLCQDESGNKMTEPVFWSISKSPPLLITQTAPEGELFFNEVTMQIFTGSGGDNGNAICSYREQGTSFYVPMENEYTTYHEQIFFLNKGDYVYNILCEDEVGNVAETSVSFSVTQDTTAAEVDSLYYLGGTLYVITNEISTCEYDTSSFSFGDGTLLAGTASTDHSFSVPELNSTYYVTCIDGFGNEMDPVSISLEYLV